MGEQYTCSNVRSSRYLAAGIELSLGRGNGPSREPRTRDLKLASVRLDALTAGAAQAYSHR